MVESLHIIRIMIFLLKLTKNQLNFWLNHPIKQEVLLINFCSSKDIRFLFRGLSELHPQEYKKRKAYYDTLEHQTLVPVESVRIVIKFVSSRYTETKLYYTE